MTARDREAATQEWSSALGILRPDRPSYGPGITIPPDSRPGTPPSRNLLLLNTPESSVHGITNIVWIHPGCSRASYIMSKGENSRPMMAVHRPLFGNQALIFPRIQVAMDLDDLQSRLGVMANCPPPLPRYQSDRSSHCHSTRIERLRSRAELPTKRMQRFASTRVPLVADGLTYSPRSERRQLWPRGHVRFFTSVESFRKMSRRT